jgi:hypothetical protein
MKQMKRSRIPITGQAASWNSNVSQKRSRRLEMSRFWRGLMIFLLIILTAAIGMAGYAARYPVVVAFSTDVLHYDQAASIDYQVMTRSNSFSDPTAQGMDLVYLKDYAEAVQARFSFDFTGDRPVDIAYRYSVRAEIQICDKSDPSQVLLKKTVVLVQDQAGQKTDGILHIEESILISLADYQAAAASFEPPEGVLVSRNLAVFLDVLADAALPVENKHLTSQPTLLIPLDQPEFRMTRSGTGNFSETVKQPVRYKLALVPLKFVVYPVAAAICLGLLVTILVTTRGRRKSSFEKKLRGMKRQARSRLLLIGDKAWEPEWCINVADFSSLVRTARKMKHPVFCFEDRRSETAAAYFYVYYGENNFCYTLVDRESGSPAEMQDVRAVQDEPAKIPKTAVSPAFVPVPQGKPVRPDEQFRQPPKSAKVPVESPEPAKPAEKDKAIPVLPETDRSSEILF